MKYFIKTYGCQMNISDSERIVAVLESAGYKKAPQENDADLVVLNVCSVRQSAIDRIFGSVKKYNKLKKANPDFKTVITGCILENDRKKFEKLFDLIVDIREIGKLNCWLHNPPVSRYGTSSELWSRNAQKGPTALKGLWNQHSDYFQITPKYQSRFTAYVPIMTGCNNFCAYCVVPYTRGREYSRPAMEVLGEIMDLVKKGYKEIILLGQNVNSYGTKFPISNFQYPNKSQISNPKYQTKYPISNIQYPIKSQVDSKYQNSSIITFPGLLKLINDIPGNFWIRFLTSHPKDMTEELIKTVAQCDKCTEYIHLALQSGDDDILKAMNRKYTAEHFLKLVKMIRKYIPSAAITTDIIVGFPGETEKQFQNTAEVMKKAKFDMAYINKYSPRTGTTAAKLDDSASWQEKKRREKILTEILKETALENNEKYIGKVVEVLIYEVSPTTHTQNAKRRRTNVCSPSSGESRIKNQESRIIYGKTRSFKNVKINSEIGNWKLESKANKHRLPENSLFVISNRAERSEKSINLAISKRLDFSPTARNDNSLTVCESLVGKFIKAKIAKAGAWGLEGKLAK